MFDVGFTELLLIGVVSLVVIGPERLPAVARTVGQYVGKLQRFVTGVKRDIRNELESGELKQLLGDQKQQIDELRKMVNTTRTELESGTREVVGDAKRKFAEIERGAKGGGASGATPDGSGVSLGKDGAHAGAAAKGAAAPAALPTTDRVPGEPAAPTPAPSPSPVETGAADGANEPRADDARASGG